MTKLDYMSDSEGFPAWLKRNRIAANLSQAEAARRAGVSRTWWWQAERGYEMKAGAKREVGHARDAVVRMADAVGGDVNAALVLCGYAPIERARKPRKTAPRNPNPEPTPEPEPPAAGRDDLAALLRALMSTPDDQLQDTLVFLRWALGLSAEQRRHLMGLFDAAGASGVTHREWVVDTPHDGDHAEHEPNNNNDASRR